MVPKGAVDYEVLACRGGRFGGPPPFREGRRGRSRSPGRYSPGRYSPGRYSYEEGSGSPRSRSGSPPPKRRRPVARWVPNLCCLSKYFHV